MTASPDVTGGLIPLPRSTDTPRSTETRRPIDTTDLKPPNLLLMLLEGRAPWEYAAMIAATPWLRRLPRGDGHPVVVFPGLAANDLTTLPLRGFLREQGYAPYAWNLGFNLGPREGVLDECGRLVRTLAERHGEKVSLIGWSLGGVYAREAAKEHTQHVRCVITLGSPFAGHPRATNAWRVYELVSGLTVNDPAMMKRIRQAPPLPTTSIYSKTDGVVAWPCSLNEDLPHTENIEVHASHIGMGMNPVALYAIADRLSQDPAQWRRFDASGMRQWFYKTGLSATTQG